MADGELNLKMVGLRLRWLREVDEENQGDFAKKIGSSQQSISRWENGGSGSSLGDIAAIAGKLNIKSIPFLDYLTKGEVTDFPKSLREALLREHPELVDHTRGKK